MGRHNELGTEGEQIAADYLLSKGYSILHRNYRYLKAEIDIIAKKDSTLAIVEVKSRTSDVFENIADTVTGKKIKLLVMATDHYITSKNIDLNIRFDIVTVLKKKNMLSIEHIEDAFYHF